MKGLLPLKISLKTGLALRLAVMYWIGGGTLFVLLALWLAWCSSGFEHLQGWVSNLMFLLVGALLLLAGWHALRCDGSLSMPRWLGWALLIAVLLRLLAGVFWTIALPRWGYGSLAEQAGYVMADAFVRDTGAWELARSHQPLWRAFVDYRMADQYGGLLFLSAWLYRYLGGAVHQPLQMVVLAASFSSLAVIFGWAFAQRAWGQEVAKVTAWLLVFYPEAVLLGSSQMREAFLMSLAMMAFYGLLRYAQERSWIGLMWMLGALVLGMPLSPAVTVLLLGALVLMAAFLGGRRALGQPRLWVGLAVMALLALTAVWLAWGRIAPAGVSNPLMLIGWWLKETAKWQAHLTERASGWFQKLFRNTPSWSHLWILLGYGVMQPFLPAALIADGAPIWRGIAIWRALGWTVWLPFLLYAPWRALQKKERNALLVALCCIVWAVIVIASLRSGGDQWDNPRYRVVFVGLQAALVAWVWVGRQGWKDLLLQRVVVTVGLMLLWFLPWYLRRYTSFAWEVVDLFKTLGLGLASAILYWMWDWARRESP